MVTTDMDADDQPLIEQVQNTDDMEADDTEPQVMDEPAGNEVAKASDAAYKGFYEWEIPNFAKLHEKQQSDLFEVGTYLWRLLCFPRGNQAGSKHVSVFLFYPEASYTPAHISPRAAFKLIIKNHKDPSKNFLKESNHVFTSDQVDWGFSQMLPLQDVSATSGYVRDDGTLVVRVEITIQRDERYTYDSRAETGFVGLKNQGATCYMNSLLQYMFNVPYFRKAVYHMPVPENEEPSKSLPVALQSLFFRLQYSRSAVSTKELTKSFGWTSYDAFMQHDVQELNRVLCEKLEDKMKNTKVEKTINELFEGHTYNFIECIDVEYKSTRKESFMDLQLDVKGCKNIYDSFDRYTEVEVLNGQNQYKTDDYGMQDARKGILFENFPPVLQLQLKRFEYDCMRDTMVKINDRYEFYEELDLDAGDGKYLSPSADRSTRNLYRLHSVLVHSGGVHGGHYFAYIRPDGKQWLKFDDERVTREEDRQALDAQFGGSQDDDYSPSTLGPSPGPLPLKYAKYSNAYMLVYVRVNDWPSIMCDTTKDDIAKHLLDRLEQEMRDKEARQRDKAEAHLYCMLKVASGADFAAQVGQQSHFDLVDHDKLPADSGHYRLRKQTKFSEFKQEVATRTGVPVDQQRYWVWRRRSNGTFRPERPLTPAEEAGQLVDLKDIRDMPREGPGGAGSGKSALMEIRLFLETPEDAEEGFRPAAASSPPPAGQPEPPGGTGEILLFFKEYDPVKETLTYRGHHMLGPSCKIGQLASFLAEEAALPHGAQLLLFEEVKFEPTVRVELLEKERTLSELKLQHGDILIYQRQLTEQDVAGLPGPVRYPTADAYLSYVHNRRVVRFRRLEEPHGEPAVTLELLKNTTYDEVCSALAGKLGLDDPSKLRFTRHNYFSAQPQRQPVKWRTVPSLEGLLTHGHHPTDTIYFEVLDLPLEQMEKLKTVKVSFHGERGEYVGEQFSVRLTREAPVSELLAEVAQRLQRAAAERAAARQQQQQQAGPGAGQQEGSSQGGAAAPGGDKAAQQAADDAALAAGAAAAAAGRPMRLLETSQSKIFKVVEPTDTIDTLNDAYWQLRAEFIPPDQVATALGPMDRVVGIAHMLPPLLPSPADVAANGAAADAGAGGEGEDEEEMGEGGAEGDAASRHAEAVRDVLVNTMPGQTFGDPILVRVAEGETMADLKAKVQATLGVPPEEFAKWHLIFVGSRPPNAVLDDDHNLTTYFSHHRHHYGSNGAAAAAAGGPTQSVLIAPDLLLLACLHDDKGGPARRQPAPTAGRYTYEKPVKIYG